MPVAIDTIEPSHAVPGEISLGLLSGSVPSEALRSTKGLRSPPTYEKFTPLREKASRVSHTPSLSAMVMLSRLARRDESRK